MLRLPPHLGNVGEVKDREIDLLLSGFPAIHSAEVGQSYASHSSWTTLARANFTACGTSLQGWAMRQKIGWKRAWYEELESDTLYTDSLKSSYTSFPLCPLAPIALHYNL